MYKKMILVTCVLGLSGCVNMETNSSRFYQGQANARILPDYIPVNDNENVQLVRAFDLDQDVKKYIRGGYEVVGVSSFNAQGNSVTEDELIDQAKKVGAQVVVFKSHVTSSSTGYSSVVSQTSWGAVGSTMPYTVTRIDFSAVYLAKFKTIFGAVVKELSIDERKTLGQNGGVKIIEIADNSPAYTGNFLPDDIIVAINGKAVGNISDYGEKTKNLPLGISKFDIIRDGKKMTKEANLMSH